MKQLSTLFIFATVCSTAAFLSGCASTGSMVSDGAKEEQRLLAQSGFQLKNASTPNQQRRLAQLPSR